MRIEMPYEAEWIIDNIRSHGYEAFIDYSWNPKRFAESTRCYHRTLQQELMKTIVEIIRMVGSKDYGTDLRNQASHELCKRIVDSGVLDEAHLPFI